MDDGVKVTTEALSGNISSFQSQMAQLETLCSSIKALTTDAKSYWEGSASDAIMGAIEKFQNVFDQISEQNQIYVDFLNQVIELYTAADNSTSNALDGNANAFDVN